MYDLPKNVRNCFFQLAIFTLATSSQIKYLDFQLYNCDKDEGEGAVILSALARSNSLPTISQFRCSRNHSWWSEGKESNVELLSDAIRAMKNLKYLNLYLSVFSTAAICDQVVSAIVANQE